MNVYAAIETSIDADVVRNFAPLAATSRNFSFAPNFTSSTPATSSGPNSRLNSGVRCSSHGCGAGGLGGRLGRKPLGRRTHATSMRRPA